MTFPFNFSTGHPNKNLWLFVHAQQPLVQSLLQALLNAYAVVRLSICLFVSSCPHYAHKDKSLSSTFYYSTSNPVHGIFPSQKHLHPLPHDPGHFHLPLDPDTPVPPIDGQDPKLIAPRDPSPILFLPSRMVSLEATMHGDTMGVCDGRKDVVTQPDNVSRSLAGPAVASDLLRLCPSVGTGKVYFFHIEVLPANVTIIIHHIIFPPPVSSFPDIAPGNKTGISPYTRTGICHTLST